MKTLGSRNRPTGVNGAMGSRHEPPSTLGDATDAIGFGASMTLNRGYVLTSHPLGWLIAMRRS